MQVQIGVCITLTLSADPVARMYSLKGLKETQFTWTWRGGGGVTGKDRGGEGREGMKEEEGGGSQSKIKVLDQEVRIVRLDGMPNMYEEIYVEYP